MIAERKEPTIPAAARASTGLIFTFPITAISVRDISGSAIPAIIAGMASRLIFLKLTEDSNFANLNLGRQQDFTGQITEKLN